MKRNLVLTFLLLVIVAGLLANTPAIQFEKVFFPPQQLNYSTYDYMHGGYDGFAVKIQEEHIPGRGIYLTYMFHADVSGMERKQNYAFFTLEGEEIHNDRMTLTVNNIREGFGTLDIDKETGVPFFAWHQVNVTPGLVLFSYDNYPYFGVPAMAKASNFLVTDNTEWEADTPHPGGNVTEFEFQWPVVKIGASPVAGKKRLYIFLNNNGRARHNSSTGTYMPSSALRIFYLDYDDEDIENNLEDEDWIFVSRDIDFFENLHNWENVYDENDPHSVRTYSAYNVSDDGVVAIAGQINANRGEDYLFPWENNHPRYDHFVVYNTNFGEDDFEVERIMYSRVYPTYEKFQFYNASGDSLLPFNYEVDEVTGEVTFDNVRYVLWMDTFNHHTTMFDSKGRLHLPTGYRTLWRDAEDFELDPDEAGYWYINGMEVLYRILFNPRTGERELHRVYPFPESPVAQPTVAFDLDDDQIIDRRLSSYNEQGQLSNWFRGIQPYYYWDRDGHGQATRFHLNQIKMTEEKDGVIGIMWVDSWKSFLYNDRNNNDYIAYAQQNEIFISMSFDSGDTWYEPLVISSVTHPEIFGASGRPAYVYPANHILKVEGYDDLYRLYFMYTDDEIYGFGSNAENPEGGLGSNIKFVAIDISKDRPLSEADPFIPKPAQMLAQNYPNPFNPTTTISFNTPVAGKVNLSVYNIKGQLVKTLVNEHLSAGPHAIMWNGTDNNGKGVASGVYFYKLDANGRQEHRKMIMVK